MKANITRKSALAVALSTAVGVGAIGNVNNVSAGSTSTNISVSATVVANCNFANVDPIAFPSYDPTSATDTTVSSTFKVRCTKGTALKLGLGQGANYLSSSNRMAGPSSNFLAYSLWRDDAYSLPWGTTLGTNTFDYTTTSNAFVTQTVYAKIVAGQDVIIGSYTDTVALTANF